ncbi:MAG TPA: transporter [Gemmatimonadales bacterium]|nr:transporter [Gemmatimonadales bacterium]
MSGRRPASLLVLCLAAAPLAAQRQPPLRDRLQQLFSFGNCGAPLCLDGSVSAANGHGDHFLPGVAAGNATIIGFLSDAIGLNAANLPLSASGSGQTFKFVGGLPVKTSASFGPVFGERAQTVGKRRVVLGANLTGINFNSLRGVPLDKLILNFTHSDVPGTGRPGLGDPEKENDIIQVRLQLYVNLLVSTFFVTYGLGDQVDLSVAVPLVHTSIQGRSEAQIYPFGGPTAVHFFTGTPENPGLTASAATFGSHTGLGDIALRLKANLRRNERFGLSVMADARLPTGSEEDLSGAGHLALRGLAIASGRFGDFAPHLNAGFLLRGGRGRNEAMLLTGGFDQPLAGWATLAVDVLSEWELGRSGLQLPGTVGYLYPFVRTVEPTNIPAMHDHRVNGSLGFKFRTPGGPILVTNALVPLRRGGLQASVTWTLGVDFNF